MTRAAVLVRDRFECEAVLTRYSPGLPMQVYGCGYGDAHPPEPEELEYELYRNGKRCLRLEYLVTEDDDIAITEALKRAMEEERCDV